MTRVFIDQRSALSIGFGEVLRSSAIFYVRQGASFSTTISFMNYWREKRGLDVALLATTRSMDGRLLERERLNFGAGWVINFVPDLAAHGIAEGSVEIEVFSTENLFIPYAAIMAVYESKRGISAVHSYARAYSRHEVEEGKTITTGEESNWTLRDSSEVRSFAVMHNGAAEQPAQTARLVVYVEDERRREVDIALPAIPAYGSVMIRPGDHIGDLVDFLAGSSGQATLSFRLNQGFTRMLVGNEARDGDDFQITHSDFNYMIHTTDEVAQLGARGHLRLPRLAGLDRWVVVYPGQVPGAYTISDGETETVFTAGETLTLPAAPGHRRFEFSRAGAPLPTRMNAGIGCRRSEALLPAEPSLGMLHAEIPTKRMTWGPCIRARGIGTRVVAHAHDETFGQFPATETISIRLYSSRHSDHLERVLGADRLDDLDAGLPIEEIFPEARSFLGDTFGYFTLYSEYGGLKAYILFEREDGSVTFEHCF